VFRLALSYASAQTDDVALASQLLQRDIRKRLGCRHMGGLEAFKAHPWFAGYDWEKLERKEAIPPFEPDVSTSRS